MLKQPPDLFFIDVVLALQLLDLLQNIVNGVEMQSLLLVEIHMDGDDDFLRGRFRGVVELQNAPDLLQAFRKIESFDTRNGDFLIVQPIVIGLDLLHQFEGYFLVEVMLLDSVNIQVQEEFEQGLYAHLRGTFLKKPKAPENAINVVVETPRLDLLEDPHDVTELQLSFFLHLHFSQLIEELSKGGKPCAALLPRTLPLKFGLGSLTSLDLQLSGLFEPLFQLLIEGALFAFFASSYSSLLIACFLLERLKRRTLEGSP